MAMADPSSLRVVEFYSGIGGMHFAIEQTSLPFQIIASMELNDVANQVYRRNFPGSNLLQKNIEGLTISEMERLKPDVILMSPPCQPFTRVGNQKASDDKRTRSFLNILNVLSSMKNPPMYILLENVKGFEVSQTRKQLIDVIEKSGYNYQEFLISPKQFGIPNSRLRYYFLAKLKPMQFPFMTSSEPLESIPQFCYEKCKDQLSSIERHPLPLSEFLENSNEITDDLYLSSEILGKFGTVLDIVTPSSSNSCCFTKAYAKYVKGTGSVLTNESNEEIKNVFELASTQDELTRGKTLLQLKLRYFSPQEVANLMCFPKSFGFPASITGKQKYKLLGNSVNVKVVAELLKYCLITESSWHQF